MSIRPVLGSRPGRIVVIAGAVIVAWQVWLAVQAAPKIPSDLQQYASPRGTVDLRVTLRFPPERFHILMFQKFGRISGTAGDAVEVRSVRVERVREIARFYWVRSITPLREGRP